MMSERETEATPPGEERRGGRCSWAYLVTALIFTPKTPDCFRDGVLFRLNSLLLNFMESFSEI